MIYRKQLQVNISLEDNVNTLYEYSCDISKINVELLKRVDYLVKFELVGSMFKHLSQDDIKNISIVTNYIKSTYKKSSSEFTETIVYTVTSLSKHLNIDSNLILALIETESSFNVNAVSSEKCKGLMQLHPNTWKFMVKQLNLKDVDIRDVVPNIIVGTFYFKRVLDSYKGDYKKALIFYNGGPYGNNTKYADLVLSRQTKFRNLIKTGGLYVKKI